MISKMAIAFAAVAMVSAASTVSRSVAAIRPASSPSFHGASHARLHAAPRARLHVARPSESHDFSHAFAEGYHAGQARHCEDENRKLKGELAHLRDLLQNRHASLHKRRPYKQAESNQQGD
jgi:hypothetical protein